MSVACVSVTKGAWAHGVSVQWKITVHLIMTTASRNQEAHSVAGEVTACVDSAPVMQMSLVRCGANTANVMTSTACASKEHCVLVSRYTSFCHTTFCKKKKTNEDCLMDLPIMRHRTVAPVAR